MKKQIMVFWVAVFALVLLPPCGLCAETDAKYDATALQELQAAVPKTPEEFMRRLKSLLDNPTNDGMELARRMVGMDMARWETPSGKGGRSNRYEKCYVTAGEQYPNLTSSFRLEIDNRTDNASSFVFGTYFMDRGYYDQKDKEATSYEKEVCIKPDLTKKILGEPYSVEAKVSRDPGINTVDVWYRYKTKLYDIHIGYIAWVHYRPKDGKTFYENFDNHKNFCANHIGIGINKDRP